MLTLLVRSQGLLARPAHQIIGLPHRVDPLSPLTRSARQVGSPRHPTKLPQRVESLCPLAKSPLPRSTRQVSSPSHPAKSPQRVDSLCPLTESPHHLVSPSHLSSPLAMSARQVKSLFFLSKSARMAGSPSRPTKSPEGANSLSRLIMMTL